MRDSTTTTTNAGSRKSRRQSSHRSKVRLIAVVFGIAAFSGAVYLVQSIIKGERLAKVSVGGFDAEKNAFLNFFYKTQDASGKEVTITSKKVTEKTKDSYIFEGVESNFALPNQETGTITADLGKVVRNSENKKNNIDRNDSGDAENSARDICEFRNNVVMSTKSGLSLRTNEATFNSKSKVISGESHINIDRDDIKISADQYSFNTAKNILELKKNARAISKGREISSEKMTVFIDNSQAEAIKKVIAEGNVRLKSADYDLYTKGNLTYGNSQISAGNPVSFKYRKDGRVFVITSYKMKAFLSKNETNSGDRDITEVLAEGNVVIKSQYSTVKADNAVYEKKKGKILARGNVVISQEMGDIFGEEAELDLSTGVVNIKKSSGIVGDNWIKKKK